MRRRSGKARSSGRLDDATRARAVSSWLSPLGVAALVLLATASLLVADYDRAPSPVPGWLQRLFLLILVTVPPLVVLLALAERDRQVIRLQLLAQTDPLTGLLNRRGVAQYAEQVVALARHTGQPLGALVADVDHFKDVNDRLGHVAGDRVLCWVAERAREAGGDQALVVRLGGEEIAVLCALPPERLLAVAERLRVAVAAWLADSGVTLSIGAFWERPQPGTDAAEQLWALVEQADRRMYEAKRAGRNRVVPAPPAEQDAAGDPHV